MKVIHKQMLDTFYIYKSGFVWIGFSFKTHKQFY